MAEFKFFCPVCGQRILGDTGYSGKQINCPVCLKQIVVPQAPATVPIPPPAPVYSLPQSTPPPTGHQYTGTLVAQRAVPIQSNIGKNVLIVLALVLVLALLGVGGWYGYSKFKLHSQRGHYPPGLVALWSGVGNANDTIGGNNGTLMNGTGFAAGKVGQAFHFPGSNAYVEVPASASLNVGTNNGFTLAGWVNPSQVATQMPIAEWNNNTGVNGIGAMLWLSVGITSRGSGNICANIGDTRGLSHLFYSADGLMTINNFQHVALTYDKSTGIAVLYRNGVAVQTQSLGDFTPQTSYPLYFGIRRSDLSGGSFQGEIDELSLYNRALSADEIQKIYAAQK